MKTVLHLSPSVRLLGARQSLLQLALHLDPARFEPVIVVPFSKGGLAEAVREAGVRCHCVRMGQWRKAKYWPRIPYDLWQLRRLSRRLGVDVVHCNEPHAAPYGLRVARSRRVPCVVHVRLDNVTGKLVRQYGLGHADRVVAVSEAVARQFDPIWDDRTERVTVIPNGVDLDGLRSQAPSREEARRALGLRAGDVLIVQAGLISPRKCCHVAVAAFAKIARDHPLAHLHFVGSPGPGDVIYAHSLDRDIARRGLIGRAQLLPFRPDIAAVYAAADINLLVSNQEGFGRVIVEAAAFGVPTIGTDAGGIPEVIVDGETGLIVPPEDPEALAQAMVRLLLDPARRGALGLGAQRRAETEYSIERHAVRMMGLFDELTGGA